ncbi:MAG: hypothetical protein M3032_12060 [Verrucomicrobiota bacterium]|nr:hypothetical protein [Verrucomicrobiota bacterium]
MRENAVQGIATVLCDVVVVVVLLRDPPDAVLPPLPPVVSRTVYAMQPVCLSSTTSLITPTSEPSDERIREPMILLLGIYSVCVDVVVDWVCAFAGVRARPTAATVAPKKMNFFMCVE